MSNKERNYKINKNNISRKLIVFLISFYSFGLLAQDYSEQINAFAKSLTDKSIEIVQPHLSDKLQFGNIPISNTSAIMNNVVNNLPKLNSITIVNSEKSKAKVAYDFVGLGKSESFIHFDEDGKILKIILVENLIKQQQQAQQQQKVPLPTPGELGKKFIPEKVEFSAGDGLLISGNLYNIGKEKPIILLAHQAGYNRIEYADIAPKLNELGYNCFAVDLRSGGAFAGKPNNTNVRAVEKGLNPKMIDAQQDITATIDYLYERYNQKVIVWGSSFSSSLALFEGLNNSKIKAIVAFSPGDYFGDATTSLSEVFSKIEKPYLATSSKEESKALSKLIRELKAENNQQQFIPKSNGFHGSRALWEGQEGAEEYWNAIIQFLAKVN